MQMRFPGNALITDLAIGLAKILKIGLNIFPKRAHLTRKESEAKPNLFILHILVFSRTVSATTSIARVESRERYRKSPQRAYCP